jgi:hypothetical protein
MKSIRSNFTLIALTAIFLLGAGCKKDDAQPTAQELISKSWLQTDLLATVSGQTESVFDSEYDVCGQDNIYTFNSNGTFSVTENTNKCDPSGPDEVGSGTWTLLEGGKKITIDPSDEDPRTLDIEELTATSMRASLTDNSLGIPIKITFVYKAK